jgi:hypothetical protein
MALSLAEPLMGSKQACQFLISSFCLLVSPSPCPAVNIYPPSFRRLVHSTFRQALDFRVEGLHLRPRLLKAS